MDRLVAEYFWQNLQDKISFQVFANRAVNIVKSRTLTQRKVQNLRLAD